MTARVEKKRPMLAAAGTKFYTILYHTYYIAFSSLIAKGLLFRVDSTQKTALPPPPPFYPLLLCTSVRPSVPHLTPYSASTERTQMPGGGGL